uniref:Endo-1,4-beta-xylanase n=1 Tax=uncultured bacterium contig00310 TaxID=1181623 RepID=A0A806K243_9BACT|nr:endo-1,4-beta-xylanase precursor [uncultured bacterium contig00310]
MKKTIQKILVIFMVLFACGNNAGAQTGGIDPLTQTEPLDATLRTVRTYTGNSNGNKALPGSPYGYEIWSSTGSRSTKLIWYGPNQGGGAAFRAEWNNSGNFLGRVGYYWGYGDPYTSYKNIFCDFNFTRSANGTAGNWSYIGIYGWSRDPLIEYYIVEDWFGSGIIGPSTMGNGAVKRGEFVVDGATYFIYEGTRNNQPSIDGTSTFKQFFSVRQTRRQAGTISVTEHFKKWDELGMKLGSSMYEAKFKIEAGGGRGWLDLTYLTFYQKD